MDVFNNFRPPQDVLNLVFDVKVPLRKNAANLREVLKYLPQDDLNEISADNFIFLEDESKLMLSASYDGDVIEYLHLLINNTGDVINALLTYVNAPENLIPVQQNQLPFIDFVTGLNIKEHLCYCAHPEPRVADIIKIEPEYINS